MTVVTLEQALPSSLITAAIGWRHHIHKHPELAFQERATSEFVAALLEQFGLKVHRGLAGTGVVGTLVRGHGRRAIAIRADMDALPIQEQSGAPYASEISNVMHACGHDGHVAMALAAARFCADLSNLDGTVHFIFQPAEESGGGARQMVNAGLFRAFPCDEVYALHNWPSLPAGTVVARNDAMMAANAVFEIAVRGLGCHGAMPHEGRDAVLAACQLVSALQSIVSRNIDPLHAAVVSATQIVAGETHNVIPDSCVVRGTTRWFDEQVGEAIENRLTDVSRSIAAAFGCEAHVNYERRYPATINDPSAAEVIRSLATDCLGLPLLTDVNPSMAAEDFAFMLKAVPGCYFWLGAAKPGLAHGLHSPRYDFNDELIQIGAALWISLVRRTLTAR